MTHSEAFPAACSYYFQMVPFGKEISTTGFSEKVLPFVIRHLLNLLDLLVCKMAKTALKLQIFFHRNGMRFFLNGIGSSILDFIKGKDL
jgi:hypothetical protein